MANATSIALLITEFIVVGGFAYGIFNFFNILPLDWMRIVLAVVIALVLGVIIYFRGRLKNKK